MLLIENLSLFLALYKFLDHMIRHITFSFLDDYLTLFNLVGLLK